MVMNGQKLGEARQAKTTVDPLGRIVSGMGNGTSVQFPEKPVKVGENWKGTSSVASAGLAGGGSVTAVYTFKGLKTVGGQKVAEIAVKLSASDVAAKGNSLTGSGTLHLLVKDGTNYDMDITTVLNAKSMPGSAKGQGGPSKISSRVQMKRK